MNQSRYIAVVIFFLAISVVAALPPGGGGSASQKLFRGFEGKVTDENGKVLDGVLITLFEVSAGTVEEVKRSSDSDEKKGLTTTTGSNGRYRFIAIRPGFYRVRYEVKGYQTLEKLMQFKRGNKDAVMNIRLRGIDGTLPAAGESGQQ